MSATSSSSLPTPRQLLTSVLNAISRLPAPERQAQGQTATARVNQMQGGDEAQPTTATNPLKTIDPSHRPLFTTLHVLFPSLLLPALDLLDRGLVTRLLLSTVEGDLDERQDVDVDMRDSEDDGNSMEAMRQTSQSPSPPSPAPLPVYLVRSAQKPTRRPPYGGGGGGDSTATPAGAQRAYLVQTTAWNCTCAAFAFSAFAPAGGGSSLSFGRRTTPTDAKGDAQGKSMGKGKDKGRAGGEGDDVHGDDAVLSGPRPAVGGRGGEEGWQFGGLSLDGLVEDEDGEAVPPCCKHLLACVLAERWEAALGRYTVRRTVGREEMAGIFADV